MPTEIHYTTGDATSPIGKGNKIICHVCNDIGGWGKGFVVALSRKWKQPGTERENSASFEREGGATWAVGRGWE